MKKSIGVIILIAILAFSGCRQRISGDSPNSAAISKVTPNSSPSTSGNSVLSPDISYTGPMNLTVGLDLGENAPINVGGAIDLCTIFPAPPAGVTMNSQCVFSGTPTTVSSAKLYGITASNAGGSIHTDLEISVGATLLPPIITAPSPVPVLHIETQDSPIVFTNSGGQIDSCSASDSLGGLLPSGLEISTNCIISGIPHVLQSPKIYNVKASNSAGNSTAQVVIEILEQIPEKPTGLRVVEGSTSIALYWNPVNFATRYQVKRADSSSNYTLFNVIADSLTAPNYVDSNVSNGAIYAYKVQGWNSVSGPESDVVYASLQSAFDITYPNNGVLQAVINQSITKYTPTTNGRTIVRCMGSLPTGFVLASDCSITGKSSALLDPTEITVFPTDSTNQVGRGHLTLSVVDDVIEASGAPNSELAVHVPYSWKITSTKGIIRSCEIDPPLPNGLSLSLVNSYQCQISGTPNELMAAPQNYTLSLINGVSSLDIGFSMQVIQDQLYALGKNSFYPSALSYAQVLSWNSNSITPISQAVTNPKEVVSNGMTTCARQAEGGVACWGLNNYGQLGNNDMSITSSAIPLNVTGIDGEAIQLVGNGETFCALVQSISGMSVQCWGRNDYGQLGNGGTTYKNSAVKVVGLSYVSKLAMGAGHVCAIKTGSEVWCWGLNSNGQLGNNSLVNANSSTPVKVSGLQNGGLIDISLKDNTSCAIANTSTNQLGGVFCWGSNNHGQIGDNTNYDRKVATAAYYIGGSSQHATQIVQGTEFTCALIEGGSLGNIIKCWGNNVNGRLGIGINNAVDYRTPTVIPSFYNATKIAINDQTSCAFVAGGTLRCWGRNNYGQVGTGNTINQISPVTVVSGVLDFATYSNTNCAQFGGVNAVQCWGLYSGSPLGTVFSNQIVSNLSLALTVNTNSSHSCAINRALTTDAFGKVYCWGRNSYGQVGDGTTATKYTPIQIGTLTNVNLVELGSNHTCIRYGNSGNIQCWGYNAYGQVGNGNTTNALSPANVLLPNGTQLSNVMQIKAGISHTCALLNSTANYKVVCWGRNAYGQLGNGGTLDSSRAVDVYQLTQVAEIYVKGDFSCARMISGGVKCWGYNSFGQLGNGTTISSNKPVDVLGLTGVKSLVLSTKHACAIISDNSVKCWGANDKGQVGVSGVVPQSSPQPVAGLANISQVDLALNHSCAVSSSGQIQCWGDNQYGQLGDGTFTSRYSPAPVSQISTAISIHLEEGFSCSIVNESDRLKCWGINSRGQLGDRTLINHNTAGVVDGGSATSSFVLGRLNGFTVLSDGKVISWGTGLNGILGNGLVLSYESQSLLPIPVDFSEFLQ